MLKDLASKSAGQDFAKAYMTTFADGRQSIVVERIKLMQLCFDKNIVTLDDFNKGFGEALGGLWMEASDFPDIENNYAHILLLAMKKGFKANELYIPPKIEKSDEKVYIFGTIREVLDHAVKRIDSGEFAVINNN